MSVTSSQAAHNNVAVQLLEPTNNRARTTELIASEPRTKDLPTPVYQIKRRQETVRMAIGLRELAEPVHQVPESGSV